MAAITQLLRHKEYSHVLDLGCGSGDFTLGFARSLGISQAAGVDSSEGKILEARSKGITAFQADLNKDALPFSNDSFDIVLMAEVIEHLENVEHCMDEVSRVVSPGGYLAITTPNLASWHGRISILLGYQPFTLDLGFRRHYGSLMTISGKSAGHIRGFTLPALKDLLLDFGFKVTGVSSAPGVATGESTLMRLLKSADRAFSPFPSLASGLVVVARSHKQARRS